MSFFALCLAAFYAFDYGGRPAEGLEQAKVVRTVQSDPTMRKVVREWTSPDGKLVLRSTETEYPDFHATEYVPELICSGDAPTEIVDGFQPLALRRASAKTTLRMLRGTVCTERDFAAESAVLGTGRGETNAFQMVATEGRSSAQWMPWWGVDFASGEGLEIGLGWTGAWRADFAADGTNVSMSAGMVKTHFRLYPGETLRQPSLLVFRRRKGVSPREMQTVIHRFMVNVKSPRDRKGELIHGISALTAGGGNKTPAMMKKVIDWKKANEMPFDCFWVDAGWNGPAHLPDLISNCGNMWLNFTGDWRFNPTVHPDGDLGKVADAAHAAGLRMLLWMEPERCVSDPPPPVFREHRDWILPRDDKMIRNKHRLLVDFGNPAALAWVTDVASEHVRRCKLDVFRQDFNLNSLPIWQANDAPDRQGITEAKHIMGLWRFWDTLRERFPHLVIENCASGGRRLDFEAVSRGHSYCRTDYAIYHRDSSQITDVQNVTLNTLAYVPFQGSESTPALVFDDYGIFSSFASGNVFTPSDWNAGIVKNDFTPEQIAWFKTVFAAGRRMMPFYEGDYYPLTDSRAELPKDIAWLAKNEEEMRWCAWQLHRPDQAAGFAIFFRRLNAPNHIFEADLGGIDAAADYEVEEWTGKTMRMSGRELRHRRIELRSPRSFMLIFYRKLGPSAGLPSAANAQPVKVIFDSDMLTDFDDVGALACLHALADKGECEILATISSTRGNASVGAMEVINAYYGRPNIPVGCARERGVRGDGVTPDRYPDHLKYRKLISNYAAWVRHPNSDDAPDANAVYRKVLSAQPDHSVVICSVGFLTNLRRLLETPPDELSELNGRDLVSRKVKTWVAMGFAYPRGREYNIMWDADSARHVLKNWPTSAVFSDGTYGGDVFAGRALVDSRGGGNPVKDVFSHMPSRDEIRRDPIQWHRRHFGLMGRASWDETAVLAAVRGVDSYFNVHRGKFVIVDDRGTNEWIDDEEQGPHVRLTERVHKAEVGRIIDSLICQQPKNLQANGDSRIRIISPCSGACVPLLKEKHRAFLSKTLDEREAQLGDKKAHDSMSSTGWWPEPVRIAWRGAGKAAFPATVTICRVNDGNIVFTEKTTNSCCEVFNLEIARDYVARVETEEGLAEVRFCTEDLAPRYLKVPCVDNFRDLGGRKGIDGRRVRQGLVYRSAKLNGFARVLSRYTREEAMDLYRTGGLEGRGTEAMVLKCRLDNGESNIPDEAFAIPKERAAGKETLTAVAKAFLTETLGVRTDLDLRDRFGSWGLTASPVGLTVRWVHSSQAFYGEMASDWGKRAFAEAFRVFLDKKNYPILFHCTGGADRTGGLALILNGLLGVDEDELIKDWEMTGFYIFTLNGGRANFTRKARLDKLLAVFDSYPGKSLNERICGYVRDCGFTDIEISCFREMLLERKDGK